MRRWWLLRIPFIMVGVFWFSNSSVLAEEDELETWYCDTSRLVEIIGRYDSAVRTGTDLRTWFFGNSVLPVTTEPYSVESEGLTGKRFVSYSDKGRLECDPPRGVSSPFTFNRTFGLLATELITGNLQLGDATFEEREPSDIAVAGDPDNPDVPTYAAMGQVMHFEPIPEGWTLIQTIDPDGTVSHNERYADHGIFAEYYIPETNHRVASVFWDFMNQEHTQLARRPTRIVNEPLPASGLLLIGFPITEAYWTTVPVAGVSTDVLVQCFERRCLTYTPDNPDGWQVEMGNIGLHYYQWRYPEGHE